MMCYAAPILACFWPDLRTVSRNFLPLFLLKKLYRAPFEQAKAVSRAFEFRKDLRMTKFEICVSMTIRTKYKTVSRAFEFRKDFI